MILKYKLYQASLVVKLEILEKHQNVFCRDLMLKCIMHKVSLLQFFLLLVENFILS